MDVCHHVHNINNSFKLFCWKFGNTLERLFDDLYTDFNFGTDLTS